MPSGFPFTIRPAVATDLPAILSFVHELAEYENLAHEVAVTADRLRHALFPPDARPAAECALACAGGEPAGFALFFPTYSTFVGKQGLWLEDLYVRPAFRQQGLGTALLHHVARLAN